MNNITLKNLVLVCKSCFSYLDNRMVDHSLIVTFLYWRLLENTKRYSSKELYDLICVALLHDIGCFATRDFDQLFQENTTSHNHTIYGSYFLKHFSHISHLSDIILYHHTNPNDFDSPYKQETILLHFVDQISLLSNNKKLLNKFLESRQSEEEKYFATQFNLINEKECLIESITNKNYELTLNKFLNQKFDDTDSIIKFLSMLSFMIDSRSETTVSHTIMVSNISTYIAKKLHFSDTMIQKIYLASILHDIGKISTPVDILEKPGKLTPTEMEIMKNHVTVTHDILKSLNSKDILEFASHHHEKLDGSGYPFGLKNKELSLPVRIIIIADIMAALMGVRSYKGSFSKEKIINILKDLASYSKIDSNLVQFVIKNYDDICHYLSKQNNLYDNFKYELASK